MMPTIEKLGMAMMASRKLSSSCKRAERNCGSASSRVESSRVEAALQKHFAKKIKMHRENEAAAQRRASKTSKDQRDKGQISIPHRGWPACVSVCVHGQRETRQSLVSRRLS